MENARKEYAELFIQDSESIHNSLEGHHKFSEIPSIWLSEIGTSKEVFDIALDKKDEIKELFTQNYPEVDLSQTNYSLGDMIIVVVDDMRIEIEDDMAVGLLRNNRLFAPIIFKEEFENGEFSDIIPLLKYDFEEYFEKLIFYLELYNEYKGDFSDSDIDAILDKAENEIFGYGFDDDFETTSQRIHRLGNDAYTEMDGMMMELDSMKKNSIDAHIELERKFNDLPNFVKRIYLEI